MKELLILTDSVEGRRNEEKGRGNQDFVGAYQDINVLCVSVNDGCSGCRYPHLAAEINAKVAEHTARSIEHLAISERIFKELLVDGYMRAMDHSGVPTDELCSTTAFVAVEKTLGLFATFNCGDSAILAFDSKLRISPYLTPKNGIRKTLTYFTNDPAAIRYVGEFRQGRLGEDIAGFILYTDGAGQIAERLKEKDNLAKALVRALYEGNYESEKNKILSHIREQTSDDISIAIIAPAVDPRLR